MYYVCIEDNQITSVLNYEPNVPNNVKVVTITDEEYELINKQNRTHYFNTIEMRVVPMPPIVLDKYKREEENIKNKEFLSSTDWKVFRHLREIALGVKTSLTNEEYLELERSRAKAAASISNK